MSVGMSSYDWETRTQQYLNSKLGQYQNNGSRYVSNDASVFDQQTAVSQETGNTCTDGKDDGKVGFFSGIGSFLKGAVKGIGNAVKGMFTGKDGKFSLGKTLKTAAMIGVCFIPYVGPAIGCAMASYGVIKGASGMVSSISAASKATTDAEKKDALENLGGSTAITAASAVALKSSAGVLKGQLSGGAGAANTYSAIKGGQGAKAVLKAVGQDAAKNATNAGQALLQKGGKVLDGMRHPVRTAKGLYGKASARCGELYRSASAKFSGTKIEGAKVNHITGKQTVTKADGTIEIYNRKGDLLQTKTPIEGGKGYTTTKPGQIEGAKVNRITGRQTVQNGNETLVYDKKGNLIKKTYTGESGTTHTYNYKKDGSYSYSGEAPNGNTAAQRTSMKSGSSYGELKVDGAVRTGTYKINGETFSVTRNGELTFADGTLANTGIQKVFIKGGQLYAKLDSGAFGSLTSSKYIPLSEANYELAYQLSMALDEENAI